ncbi:hypothetical protein A2572_04330 [Candidatus Collierbacteria bacterium RIFOXYD1_FULL_40_9]|uniref:Uncharacterized protein n=1 Tax=Candidatus Collierbacteria bacterium RIFOXYD1_FULL_40_9 TaxID=1817731 RepID=A0A1F5FPW2_9BACT|nr:MAG: hypothetical protein A2572_04330 [Candidatus Collierbacteria bacterium RIFOXYD1_FULL_40_9]
MTGTKGGPRLFYSSPDCGSCKLSLYDFNELEWISNTTYSPVPGDHVVIDGVEQVFLGDDEYRYLEVDDEQMWDEQSLPDEIHAPDASIDDLEDDPYIRVRRRYILSHW